MLRKALTRIALEFPSAAGEQFAKHPLAEFIRGEAVEALENSIAQVPGRFKCKGSAGAGQFAGVPWLAILDELVTDSATRGYYVVYLFAEDGRVHLSLNQGATAVKQEFGRRASSVLSDRASLMRARLPEFAAVLPATKIELKSRGLPRFYEWGHAIGCSYASSEMPGNNQLSSDLHNCLTAYATLTFRGGLDPSLEWSPERDENPVVSGDLTEIRRYRLHRTIERNPRLAQMAKVLLGTRCQVCDFEFSEVYGSIGEGFIEAHHLQPLSTLQESVPVALDPGRDFAVLCSNCHRMVHRQDDPSDLNTLRSSLMIRRH